MVVWRNSAIYLLTCEDSERCKFNLIKYTADPSPSYEKKKEEKAEKMLKYT